MIPARILPLALALLATPGSAAEKFTFSRQIMGTRFTVLCYADNQTDAAQATEAAFAKAEEINAAASDYLPESELSLLAAKPVGKPIPLSPILYDLLSHSQQIAKTTNGAFDPTLGPLTKLWRESRDQDRLPHPDKLRSAQAATGWQHFTLDPQARTITLHQENMAFDLGGIAKGYAADLMLDSLTASGLPQCLIAAGGDIRLGDPPPGRDGWRVAIQTFDPAKPDEVIILSNAAVSTSGDLHQFVIIDGIRYSHILDPASGLGLTRRIAVSVIADKAKLSDPLATAACVLGPDHGAALRDLPGVRELRIRTPQETTSPNRKTKP